MAQSANIEVVLSMIDQMTRPMAGIEQATERLQRAFADMQRQIQRMTDNSITQLSKFEKAMNKISNFGEKLKQTGDAMMSTGISQIKGAIGMGLTIFKPIQEAIRMEDIMADIYKVSGKKAEDVAGRKKVKDMLEGFATTLPQSMAELGAAMKGGYMTGRTDETLEEYILLSSQAAVALDMSADAAANYVAGMQNVLKIDDKATRHLLDTMNYLGNTEATTGGEILAIFSDVSGFAKQAGFDDLDTLALSATLSASKVAPGEVGTTMKNLLLALTNPDPTGQLEEAYRDLGLNPVELATLAKDKKRGGGLAALLKYFKALGQVDKIKRTQVMTAFGGKYGVEGQAKIFGNLDMFQRIITKTRDDEAIENSSILNEFLIRSGTTSNAIQLMMNKITIALASLGEAALEDINMLISGIGDAVMAAVEWIKSNQKLLTWIFRIVGGVVGFNLAVGALNFVFGGFIRSLGTIVHAGVGITKFFAAIPGGAGKAISKIAQLASGFAAATVETTKFALEAGGKAVHAVADFGGKLLIGIKRVALFAWTLLVKAVTAVASFAWSLITSAVSALWSFGSMLVTTVIPAVWSFTVALLSNPITWVVLAIAALIAAIVACVYYWDEIKAAVCGFVDTACEWLSWLWETICDIFSGVWGAITAPFRAAYDTIVGLWSDILNLFGMGVSTSVTVDANGDAMSRISSPSGMAISTPGMKQIADVAVSPLNAAGGYFDSPTLGIFGEDGGEWIINQDGSDRTRSMIADAAAANGISLGRSRGERPIVITSPIYISVPETENADKFVEKLAQGLRHYAETQGAVAY